MGSYGIGVERAMAAIVESSHDDKGIVWPVSVAPYEVVITAVRVDSGDTLSEAEELYGQLQSVGIETILDDRDERPGVKFADAELIGIPYRVTLGPRGLDTGIAEVTVRRGLESREIPLEEVVGWLLERVGAERSATTV